MASVDDTSNTGGKLIAASKVSGTNVYNNGGEKLGIIHDVMLEKISGKAAYAIMSFGGFLGVGEQYHPLPWNQLTYDEQQGGYVVALDRQQLEGAPVYSNDEVNIWDERRAQDVDAYYGSQGTVGVAATRGPIPSGSVLPP